MGPLSSTVATYRWNSAEPISLSSMTAIRTDRDSRSTRPRLPYLTATLSSRVHSAKAWPSMVSGNGPTVASTVASSFTDGRRQVMPARSPSMGPTSGGKYCPPQVSSMWRLSD